MRTEEEIRKELKRHEEALNEIVQTVEKEEPQELYWYLQYAEKHKFVIYILKWILQENEE